MHEATAGNAAELAAERVGAALQKLSSGSRRWLHVMAEARRATAPPFDAAQALNQEELGQFITLLRAQNLAAKASFIALSPALQAVLDKSDFQLLNLAMDRLNYQEAARLLQKLT
jgi:hypothetical protein